MDHPKEFVADCEALSRKVQAVLNGQQGNTVVAVLMAILGDIAKRNPGSKPTIVENFNIAMDTFGVKPN